MPLKQRNQTKQYSSLKETSKVDIPLNQITLYVRAIKIWDHLIEIRSSY